MIIKAIEEFWYTKIRRFHKHTFVRISDGNACGFVYQRHACTGCGKILSLDDWQINDLPIGMKYSKWKYPKQSLIQRFKKWLQRSYQ